jgi:hypothetical protein
MSQHDRAARLADVIALRAGRRDRAARLADVIALRAWPT